MDNELTDVLRRCRDDPILRNYNEAARLAQRLETYDFIEDITLDDELLAQAIAQDQISWYPFAYAIINSVQGCAGQDAVKRWTMPRKKDLEVVLRQANSEVEESIVECRVRRKEYHRRPGFKMWVAPVPDITYKIKLVANKPTAEITPNQDQEHNGVYTLRKLQTALRKYQDGDFDEKEFRIF